MATKETMELKRCPESLLTAPDSERLRYFAEEALADHPILDSTVEAILDAADPNNEESLVLLVGPTGAGKTVALRLAVQRALLEGMDEMRIDRAYLPAAVVQALAPDKGAYRFSSLDYDLLLALHAPLINRTLPDVVRDANGIPISTTKVEHAGTKPTPEALLRRTKAVIEKRRLRLIGIDEGANLFKIGRARTDKERLEGLREQADKLRSRVNDLSTKLVIAGAYDFFELANSSGQLARRATIIHLRPYLTSSEDIKGFSIALVRLFALLPIKQEVKPEDHALEFLVQSLGCIGLFKTILYKALKDAIKQACPLSIKHIRSRYFKKATLETMRRELESGMGRVMEVLEQPDFKEFVLKEPPADAPPTGNGSRPLKPGETRPSHRTDATSSWENA